MSTKLTNEKFRRLRRNFSPTPKGGVVRWVVGPETPCRVWWSVVARAREGGGARAERPHPRQLQAVECRALMST